MTDTSINPVNKSLARHKRRHRETGAPYRAKFTKQEPVPPTVMEKLLEGTIANLKANDMYMDVIDKAETLDPGKGEALLRRALENIGKRDHWTLLIHHEDIDAADLHDQALAEMERIHAARLVSAKEKHWATFAERHEHGEETFKHQR